MPQFAPVSISHSGPVQSVLTTEKHIITVAQDEGISIFDAKSLKKLHHHSTGDADVSPACLHEETVYLSIDDKIQRFSLVSGELTACFGGSEAKEYYFSRDVAVLNDALVFVNHETQSLICLDIATGEERWNQVMEGWLSTPWLSNSESIWVTDDRGNVFNFDVNTGKVLWDLSIAELGRAAEGPAACAKGVLQFFDDCAIGFAGQNQLVCFDFESGDLLWCVDALSNATSPIIHDEQIFVLKPNFQIVQFEPLSGRLGTGLKLKSDEKSPQLATIFAKGAKFWCAGDAQSLQGFSSDDGAFLGSWKLDAPIDPHHLDVILTDTHVMWVDCNQKVWIDTCDQA
jgi:outer membrane protein assembly factor BamB